jgi:hypothetical protein
MSQLIQYFVPSWISILFLLLIPIPFILIANLVRKELKPQFPKAFTTVIVFFIVYLVYIGLAAYLGWFNQVLFPPKVLLFTTFPFAFTLFVLVVKTKEYNSVLERTPIELLVQLHIFRIIGVFFVLLALHDALPKPFAFIAGIGDMLTAITSVFVVNAIRNKKSYAKKLTYFWNIFGTVDILFTAIAANVITKISIDTGIMGVDTLAMFPFSIIPAFAPPVILFLHYTIFKKIKQISV